jgi:putative flippase GtrA
VSGPDRRPPAHGSLFRTFAIYAVFGACAFATDYSVFLIVLSSGLGPYTANVLGICTGIAVSFSLNRCYNFRKTDLTARRAARFATVALTGMGVSTLIIMLLAAQSVDVRVAKVVAMLGVFFMQFTLNALWTFR